MVIVGSSELVRKMRSRQFIELAGRLITHVHLLPLDLDEARTLVSGPDKEGSIAPIVLETMHRDAAGNPRRLLQLLRTRNRLLPSPALRRGSENSVGSPEARSQVLSTESRSGELSDWREIVAEPSANQSLGSSVEPDLTLTQPQPASVPALIPSRPPLRVEEGMIEVGWSGSLEAESALSVEADSEAIESSVAQVPATELGLSDETIDDHYAALQAWTEWARNRGQGMEQQAPGVQTEDELVQRSDNDEPGISPSESMLSGVIRAEGQHEHAPYSQLFSRLRQQK
jgi:general secretion pathway protein A